MISTALSNFWSFVLTCAELPSPCKAAIFDPLGDCSAGAPAKQKRIFASWSWPVDDLRLVEPRGLKRLRVTTGEPPLQIRNRKTRILRHAGGYKETEERCRCC